MSAEASAGGRGERIGSAVAAFALAIFLGAITFGVLSGEPSEDSSAFLVFLLQVFFALVVGGIALGCAGLGVQLLVTPERAALRAASLPASLGRFCPGCGEASGPDDVACARCAHPFLGRAGRWRTDEKTGLLTAAFLAALGAGLLCLGVGVGVGPFLEGERRLWALVAFGGLGLLLGGVGALFLYGLGLTARDALRGVERWTYHWSAEGVRSAESGSAVAHLARGSLVHASGERRIERAAGSFVGPGTRLPELTEDQRAFVRGIFGLYRARLLALWAEHRDGWRIGAPLSGIAPAPDAPAVEPGAAPERTQGDAYLVRLLEGAVGAELRPALEVLVRHLRSASVVPAPGEPVASLADLWVSVRSDRSARASLGAVPHPEPGPEPDPVEIELARAIAPLLAH